MIVAKITKFIPICNAFVGAMTTASDVPVLLPLKEGLPLYPKGCLVAYIDSPAKMFKGHLVKGSLKTIPEVVLSEQAAKITDVDVGKVIEEPEIEENWGLN